MATATTAVACDPSSNPFGCEYSTELVQNAAMRSEAPHIKTVQQRMQTLQTIAAKQQPETLRPGDLLPADAMVVLNTAYRGLPPAQDGWWYFKTDGEVYRANHRTREVLERVTHQMKRKF